MENFTELLRQIAIVLSISVDYIFQVYTRQNYLVGLLQLVQWAVVIGGAILTSVSFFRVHGRTIPFPDPTTSYHYEDKVEGYWLARIGFTVLVTFVSFLVILFVVVGLGDAWLHLANPEYYAIDSLLRAARGK